ncbi:MAG TPA: glycosyltransferase [Methylophaga aminisulfidivorans]|uniref:glycosyltransferase n=1 Tax=Methylophaga TaxID=40222 RepID=UPI00177052F4|nr:MULTISPECIES: glycosyltransferase [Methylophaga]HIC46053.1 glycosyltransferase [Methylophaga sp.]HIM39302.1 glycosyltransferase [Methylophaga aminisulfidivorans]
MTQSDYVAAPLVSVVMAVYDGEEYIDKAIQSILNQEYKNFEFIIINDGSNDNTQEIINKYHASDSRIVTISRENKGLVASLNEGVHLARGELIARMDADDISFLERLGNQVAFMDANPQVVCCGSFYEVIDEDGDSLTILDAPTEDSEIQKLLMQGHTVICHPTAMFRKSVFLNTGGYQQKFYLVEDLDLWIRLGEFGQLANIPLPLVKYRTNCESVSAQNSQKQLHRASQVIAEASNRRGVSNSFSLKTHWRPDNTKKSQYIFATRYGWWAFKNNNRTAALKYSRRALKLLPWKIEAWKLLFRSLYNLKM